MKMRDQQWLQKEKLQLNVNQQLKKQLLRGEQLQRERQPLRGEQLQRERQLRNDDRSSKILTIVN